MPVVRAPGGPERLDASGITLRAPADATVPIQLRWSRWLTRETRDGRACIARDGRQRVTLRTASGGSYRVTSTLAGPSGHC